MKKMKKTRQMWMQASEAGDILLAHSASCGYGEKRMIESAYAGGNNSFFARDITNAGHQEKAKGQLPFAIANCLLLLVRSSQSELLLNRNPGCFSPKQQQLNPTTLIKGKCP